MRNSSPITLVKGDKHGEEVDYRDYLPVNMTAILRKILNVDGYMYELPGLTEMGQGVGIDRGAVWNERLGNHYRVSGNQLVQVSATGAATSLDTISGLDHASLPYSFDTQGIIADEKFWLWDGSTLTQVTDPDVGLPIDGVWIDGYYMLTDGEYLYHTDLGAETSINALQYATSEFSPDPTVGLGVTQDSKVIAFNRYSIDYFVNKANANFAFSIVKGRSIKAGLVGTHCKVEMNGNWYFMGGRKNEAIGIHLLGPGRYEKVSSRHVDQVIEKYSESELSDCLFETRTIAGYPYLIAHLPNETLMYSEKAGQSIGKEYAWSVLRSGVGSQVYRALNGIYDPRTGRWVYGDKNSSKFAYLDSTVATHFGDEVEWELYTPFIYIENMSIDELEIDTIPGFNINDDASVFVSLTNNGVTHGTELSMNYGKPGDYGARFIKRRLGHVNDWFAFKLRGVSTSRMTFSRAVIKYG